MYALCCCSKCHQTTNYREFISLLPRCGKLRCYICAMLHYEICGCSIYSQPYKTWNSCVYTNTWKQPHEDRADLSFCNSSSFCLVHGAEEERRLRSMMGIGDVVEESSSVVSSPSLQIYGAGGSSPWSTISWTRFDSNTSAEGTETSAIYLQVSSRNRGLTLSGWNLQVYLLLLLWQIEDELVNVVYSKFKRDWW